MLQGHLYEQLLPLNSATERVGGGVNTRSESGCSMEMCFLRNKSLKSFFREHIWIHQIIYWLHLFLGKLFFQLLSFDSSLVGKEGEKEWGIHCEELMAYVTVRAIKWETWGAGPQKEWLHLSGMNWRYFVHRWDLSFPPDTSVLFLRPFNPLKSGTPSLSSIILFSSSQLCMKINHMCKIYLHFNNEVSLGLNSGHHQLAKLTHKNAHECPCLSTWHPSMSP